MRLIAHEQSASKGAHFNESTIEQSHIFNAGRLVMGTLFNQLIATWALGPYSNHVQSNVICVLATPVVSDLLKHGNCVAEPGCLLGSISGSADHSAMLQCRDCLVWFFVFVQHCGQNNYWGDACACRV